MLVVVVVLLLHGHVAGASCATAALRCTGLRPAAEARGLDRWTHGAALGRLQMRLWPLLLLLLLRVLLPRVI